MNDEIIRILKELNKVNEMLQERQKFLSEHFDSIRTRLEAVNYVEKQLSEISVANKLPEEMFTPDLEEHFRQMSDFEARICKVGNLIDGDAIKQISDAASIAMKERELMLSPLSGLSPSLEEANKLAEEARRAFQGLSLSPFLPEERAVLDIIKSVDIGPLMAGGLIAPLENITALKTLGNAVQLPYMPESIDAINALLGDWKANISFPTEIFDDVRARIDFYKSLGFDSRLTNLPEPVFTKTLYKTGILRDDLFSQTFPYVKKEWEDREDDEEEIVRERMVGAYDMVSSFEIDIREWINEVMTDKFGQNWVKHRVPGNVLVEWRSKREEALRKGEKEKRLLWYADFTDYIKIIERNDNWDVFFSSVFYDKMDIQVSFQRLHTLRIPTMHARILGKEDMLLLSVEVQRVLRAIGKIRDNN